MPTVDEAFHLLRAISFVTPATALLLNLINTREGKEEIHTILFTWVLASFICLILAAIADIICLIYPAKHLLIAVKLIFLVGMVVLLWATGRFLVWLKFEKDT